MGRKVKPHCVVIDPKTICPNCYDEMKKNKRKFGTVLRWMVCGNCGLRKKPFDQMILPKRKIVIGFKVDLSEEIEN